jgi:hypothetical protein
VNLAATGRNACGRHEDDCRYILLQRLPPKLASHSRSALEHWRRVEHEGTQGEAPEASDCSRCGCHKCLSCCCLALNTARIITLTRTQQIICIVLLAVTAVTAGVLAALREYRGMTGAMLREKLSIALRATLCTILPPTRSIQRRFFRDWLAAGQGGTRDLHREERLPLSRPR